MKRVIFLLTISLITFSSLKSQNWVSNDAIWHYDFYVTGAGFYKVLLGNDTTIQNKICQKFITKKYEFWPQPSGIYIQGAVIDITPEFTYTSGDTVFYFEKNKFFVLFNFNANIGEEWVISDKTMTGVQGYDTLSRVKVLDTTSVNINGVLKKAILLQTIDGSLLGIDGWVVENIGPIGSQYLFPTGRNSDSTVVCFEQHYLKCYQDSLIGLYNPSGIDCEYLLNHVGIDEKSEQLFTVYPNPTPDIFNIKFSKNGEYKITLYDQNGKIISVKNLSNAEGKINLSGLPNGVYVLKIENDNRNMFTKIIKK